MHVTLDKAPPPLVAYAEDAHDRLWTGKGAGVWRCLHAPPATIAGDDPGRACPAGSWREVWLAHGPLVPLVPAGRLAVVAVAREFAERLGPTAPLPLTVADQDEPAQYQWARRVLAVAARSVALLGKPVGDWAPGYVWAACGHPVPADRFRSMCDRDECSGGGE